MGVRFPPAARFETMKTKIPFLILAAILPVYGRAAQPRALLCRDGKPPSFTGHPFKPFLCGNEPSAQAALVPAVSSAPVETSDKAKSTFEPLVGRWEGLLNFSGTRYTFSWEVKKGWFGSFHVEFKVKNYYLGTVNDFRAKLKNRGTGRYEAKVELESLPGPALKAEVRLGLAPKPADGEEPFQQAITIAYEGHPPAHLIRFNPPGPNVHYEYADLTQPNLRYGGDLTRSQKQAP